MQYVGMTPNQWEAVLEIIADTDDPENWNLSESIKDQIYCKEERVDLPDILPEYKTVNIS